MEQKPRDPRPGFSDVRLVLDLGVVAVLSRLAPQSQAFDSRADTATPSQV